MNDIERRAHEIALAALPISYDKAKRQAEIKHCDEFKFDTFVTYFDLYNQALYALSKNPNSEIIG